MLIVHGNRRKLTAPKDEIDCGNSGTTMRLLAGIARRAAVLKPAGRRWLALAPADGPHHRAAAPDGREDQSRGRQGYRAAAHRGRAACTGSNTPRPVASAQLKSALLFAGLFAKGKTTVQEPVTTRNHTELMLNYFLVRTHKDEHGVSVYRRSHARVARLQHPGRYFFRRLLARRRRRPTGRSSARQGCRLERNPHRHARRARAHGRAGARSDRGCRPGGTARHRSKSPARISRRTVIQGKEIPQLIDELPILAVAGALANGTTIIRHAQELRVKETDRIAAIAHNLRSMGAQVVELRTASRSTAALRSMARGSPVSAITASPWPLRSPACSRKARPSSRMSIASRLRIPVSRKR